jgi:hypothetical protein
MKIIISDKIMEKNYLSNCKMVQIEKVIDDTIMVQIEITVN